MSDIVLAFPGFAEEMPRGEAVALTETATSQLRRAPYLELRQIVCTWRDGVLQLQGKVSSYYLRQIAQSLVQGLEGVEAIDNQLEVMPARLPKNRRL